EGNKVGAGYFELVYRGILDDSNTVAVKILNSQNEEAHKSFSTKCEVLGRVHHRNLIRVINYCSMPRFKALVLRLMPNRSLEVGGDEAENGDEDACRLSLSQILSISMDIAHGMAYLHHHYPPEPNV
ncbi:hypothetical protein KI387_016717, partial [Taxus chinensis]